MPEKPLETRTLTEAKALAALANPFRARIIDALKVDGASTASALAQRTGQAVGSASHHLKVLHDADLIEEAPELAKDRRERWWRLTSPSTRWSRAEFAQDQAAVSAAKAAEALALQRQFERASQWQANSETTPEWDATAFVTQHWMRLTPDELAQVADELLAVLSRWSHRELPDDGAAREPVLVFARGFPAQP
jgi:DNA-binding transcriptional ArsR family regulator